MPLTNYTEYGQAIRNALPGLFKKMNIKYTEERGRKIDDYIFESMKLFTQEMKNNPNDFTMYDEKANQYMKSIFNTSLSRMVKYKLEDQLNEPDVKKDDKKFYSLFTSFFQSSFNKLFGSNLSRFFQEKYNDPFSINNNFKPSEELNEKISKDVNAATDIEIEFKRNNRWTASVLKSRATSTIEDYDNQLGDEETRLANLSRDYLLLKKQYESRGPIERFFFGGGSRIAMRKAKNRLEAAYRRNNKGLKEFDAAKYALKNVKPSKSLANFVESFKTENFKVDTKKFEQQFEIDKANRNDFSGYEVEEIDKDAKTYYDMLIEGKKVDVENLSVKQSVSYSNAVKSYNKHIDNQIQELRNNQLNELKKVAREINDRVTKMKTDQMNKLIDERGANYTTDLARKGAIEKEQNQFEKTIESATSRSKLLAEINKVCNEMNIDEVDGTKYLDESDKKELRAKKINFDLGSNLKDKKTHLEIRDEELGINNSNININNLNIENPQNVLDRDEIEIHINN